MGKKNKRQPKSGAGSDAAGTDKPLAHNPFAALASVSAPPGPEPATPPPPETSLDAAPGFASKVVVRREKKGRGGKTVTRITGVLGAVDAMPKIKRALGCGATLEGDDIVLLGDVGDRAAAWLEKEGARRIVRGS